MMGIGDNVIVNLPGGKLPGKIFNHAPPYQISGEKRFEVHGKGFVTITSARSIYPLCASCGEEIDHGESMCEVCEEIILLNSKQSWIKEQADDTNRS